MRTAITTTTKGGGGYNDSAVNGEKCNEGGQKEVGDVHGGKEK